MPGLLPPLSGVVAGVLFVVSVLAACSSEPPSLGSGASGAEGAGAPAAGTRDAVSGAAAVTGGATSSAGAGAGGTIDTSTGRAGSSVGGQTGTAGAAGASGAAAGRQSFGGSGGRQSETSGGSGGSGALAGNAGGAGESAAAGGGALLAVTVYIAGDSTVQSYADSGKSTDQAGWGQMIGQHFDERVSVENRAIGGRTARRFIDEGRLGDILEDLESGDYLLVQFGTNDGNRTATYEIGGQAVAYYLDPATDFKRYLRQYLDGARAKQGTPVLVTPPPRNSAYCTGGNGTGAHAQAMRELGSVEGVAVLDLNEKTVDYLTAICPAPMPEDFFLLRADGTVDGTHFQENGARRLAQFVVEELERGGIPLAAYLR